MEVKDVTDINNEERTVAHAIDFGGWADGKGYQLTDTFTTLKISGKYCILDSDSNS